MDPFSTVASALQVAAVAADLLKSITRFIDQTKTIKDWIKDLYHEVDHLAIAVHDISHAFSERRQKYSFECRHHDRIHSILKSCHKSLEKLDLILPELKNVTTPIQELKLSIQKSWKEERIKEIMRHITSYTRILQLSLSTLSLSELWANRESQDMILAEVREINLKIRTADLISGRPETRARVPPRLSAIPDLQSYTPPLDEEVGSVLDDEIREWRESVDEIAAAVSLSIPDGGSIDGRQIISLHSTASNATLPSIDDDESDSDEELDGVSRKLMQLTLESNQKIVQQLTQSEIFFQAAEYQRRGIEKRRRLDEGLAKRGEKNDCANDVPELADMREKLAEILFRCDTIQADKEAEEVLEELLECENKRIGTNDTDRQWRLYHKLGQLYMRQGNFRKSRKYLKNAFMGRSRGNPRRPNLVIASANMLINSLQELQLFDEAQGVRSWLEKELPIEYPSDYQPSTLPLLEASSSYRWSMEKGFDVNSLQFGFDICDPRMKTTPICLAIQERNIEVLRSMLSVVPHVEHQDSSGVSAMHHAAATFDKQVCALLLDKAANVNVIDRRGRTPLHRCQSDSGGVGVAELILDRSPELVDRVDSFGRSALYMACQAGNKEMAEFLLSRGANPNQGASGLFIPLIGAIDAVAQSRATIHLVKLLLDCGADVRLRDGNGRTAFETADGAGLCAGEIKKLLDSSGWRRPSTTSTIGTVDTTGAVSISSGTNTSTSAGSYRSVAPWKRRQVGMRPPG